MVRYGSVLMGITTSVNNYRVDCAWHHRIWVMSHFEVDLNYELELCSQLLHEDQRNFHCWNYRRYVVYRASSSPPSSSSKTITDPSTNELEYSFSKIKENFSNYSAFQHRSIYIKTKLTAMITNINADANEVMSSVSGDYSISNLDHNNTSGFNSNTTATTIDILKNILEPELTIVENAVFTEPDDQSAWWYHQFLLTWISNNVIGQSKRSSASGHRHGGSDVQRVDNRDHDDVLIWFVGVLKKQLEMMSSLLDLEDRCRWIMNSMVFMINLLVSSPYRRVVLSSSLPLSLEVELGDEVDMLLRRKDELLQRLIDVDPDHANRYLYLLTNNGHHSDNHCTRKHMDEGS